MGLVYTYYMADHAGRKFARKNAGRHDPNLICHIDLCNHSIETMYLRRIKNKIDVIRRLVRLPRKDIPHFKNQ